MRRLRRWLPLGVLALAAAVAAVVLLLSGSSGSGFSTARLPSATVVYPSVLQRERPLRDGRMVFLAQHRGRGGLPGESEFVRAAAGAVTDLGTDVRLLDAVQRFTQPGRQRLAERAVRVPGAVGAYELESQYPSRGATLRRLDLIVRTARGGSYHLVLVGPAAALTPATVRRTATGFRPAG